MIDSFVLFTDQNEIINKLSDEQAGKLFKAIFVYAATGEIPTEIENDLVLDIVFTTLKQTIDRNQEKWQEIKQKRSEAGKKHKGNQYTNNETSKDEMEQMEQNGTNGTNNVSVNDSVSVSVSGSVSTAVAVDNTQAAATDKVVRFYLDNINPLPTPNEIENLEYYEKQLSPELLIFGMQKAVDQKVRKMAYIKSIWDTWISKGITTLEEAKEESNKFKNKAPPKEMANKYFAENDSQYTNLDRFYCNV